MKQISKHIFLLFLLTTISSTKLGAEVISSGTSPDGQIKVELSLDAGALSYQVFKNDGLIIKRSQLGIITNATDFTNVLSHVSTKDKDVDETYNLPSGKTSVYQDNYKEITTDLDKSGASLQVVFRIYNDGYAFRYVLDEGGASIEILSEKSNIIVNNFNYSWAQKYKSDYSWYYEKRDWTQNIGVSNGVEFCAPILVQTPTTHLLITEAANYGTYSTSKIKANNEKGNYYFEPKLPIKSGSTLETPWRVVVMGSIPAIMETNLIENLNPPTDLTDISWIKPGRSSWDWGGEDAKNTVGLEIAKKYIDYAHDMGWEYFTLDDGWESSSAGYALEEVVDYAASKNVGLIIWTHQNKFTNSRLQVRERLRKWSDLGIKGFKVDFFEDDAQDMMKKYDVIIDEAGKLKLLVNLHGCTKPSGTRRKWPHLLTSEAVLGGEMYLFNSTMTPAYHNINLTMTRNVIGSMDYTPGDFATKNGRVRQFTTWAHQMTLLTAFESGLQYYIDCPENYRYHVAESFFKRLPAAWDETKTIEALPDAYTTIARRKGNDWYVASLCYEQRDLNLSLDFLEEGVEYNAYIYKDGDCKSEIKFDYKEKLTRSDVLNIPMLKSGGVTIHLSTDANYEKANIKKYEAEAPDNKTFGRRTSDPAGLCSGNKIVENLGRGNYLRFQNVEVQTDGEYAVSIYYMTNADSDSYLKVNDEAEIPYLFKNSGGWTGAELGYMTVVLNLKAGANIIELGSKENPAPNIDRITVKPLQDSTISIIPNTLQNEVVVTTLNQSVNIESQSEGIVTIYTLEGQRLAQQLLEIGQNSISLNSGGVYIVNVSIGRESFSSKIILK